VNSSDSKKAGALNWYVYIIEASDHSLYTGITTDPERRFLEHFGSTKNAKYFNGRKPLRIAYREAGHNRSSASKRESEIKKLARPKKIALISGL
jgi:putative endonuclease